MSSLSLSPSSSSTSSPRTIMIPLSQSDLSKEEEEYASDEEEEKDQAFVAAAETEVDLSTTPAFMVAQTHSEGSKAEGDGHRCDGVDLYKAKYTKLHKAVLTTYNLESSLQSTSHTLKTIHDTVNTNIQTQKKNEGLLTHTLSTLTSKISSLQQDIQVCITNRNNICFLYEELLSSKKEQENGMNERADKEKRKYETLLGQLIETQRDLQDETSANKLMMDKEKKAEFDYLDKLHHYDTEIASLDRKKTHYKNAIVSGANEPERLAANVALLENVYRDLGEEYNKLSVVIAGYETSMSELMKKRREETNEVETLGAQVDDMRIQIAKKKNLLDELIAEEQKEEYNKSHLQERIQEGTQQAKMQKNQLYALNNEITELTRKIDEEKKKYEKNRRKKETILSVLRPTKEMIISQEAEISQIKDSIKKETIECKQNAEEQEILISVFLKKENLDEKSTREVQQRKEDRKRLEEEIQLLHSQEYTLTHTVNHLLSQRTLKFRELSLLSYDLSVTEDSILMGKMKIKEEEKELLSRLTALESVGEKYELLKNSKNSLISLVGRASASLTAMNENIKILNNEIDVLSNESIHKEVKYEENKKNYLYLIEKRDHLRTEENRKNIAFKKKLEKLKIIKKEIKHLENIIFKCEGSMAVLRSAYISAVEIRNNTGILLIDRNDEIALLYEKVAVMEERMKAGEREFQLARTKLKSDENELKEIQRRLALSKKNLPSHTHITEMENEKFSLIKQLNEEKERVLSICNQLETPPNFQQQQQETMGTGSSDLTSSATGFTSTGASSPSLLLRSRQLTGLDPDPDQLATQLEQLESRMEQKKRALLEKELILCELTTQIAILRVAVSESRPSVLASSGRVTEIKSEVARMTKSLKAIVSELSVYQAICLKLTFEWEEMKKKVQVCEERLAAGLTPSVEVELEYGRREREKNRQKELFLSIVRHKAAEEEMNALALTGTIKSTATPRPNAYIQEKLGIPKPYGGLAPFKPTQLGGQIRHFRPPQPKEIIL